MNSDWSIVLCMCPGPLILAVLILSSFIPRNHSVAWKYSLPPKVRRAQDAKEVFEAEIDDEM